MDVERIPRRSATGGFSGIGRFAAGRCSRETRRPLRNERQNRGASCAGVGQQTRAPRRHSHPGRGLRRALGRGGGGRTHRRRRERCRHVHLHYRHERRNTAHPRRLRRCARLCASEKNWRRGWAVRQGDIFEAIARRANSSVAALSQDLAAYRAGQTGLLRLTWDNGDRTVLVNPELGGITLGWHLTHGAQDELFAAIEGTAFHTRVILERMEQHGVPIRRVINAGGIPQKNETLNRVYASVMNKPILVPQSDPTSIGSAIFAFLAAGTYPTVEEAQVTLCPNYTTVEPDSRDAAV